MTGAGGYYDTLGVRLDASAAEIRDAYRDLARRHHPDRRTGDEDRTDSAAMAAINEAYRVLGEPARRAVYDASLRTGSAVAPSVRPGQPAAVGDRVAPLPPLPPTRFPWKLLIGMFLVGVVVVLVGAALYRPKAPAPPDNLIGPGSCVTIEANGDAREINCSGEPGELVVTALVGMDERCPNDTEGHRDHQGRGLACVATSVP